jgi:altronate hydrolase
VHQEEDMDFICGTVIDGSESVAQAGERFLQLILDTASGKKSKSEDFGYGDDEFAPWTIGATM